jgi:T5orf172 domain
VIWKWTDSARRRERKNPFFWIAAGLCEDLTKSEIKYGFIYAFKATDRRGKGFVKIGFSSDIGRRLREHLDCYDGCKLIYPAAHEDMVMVRHAKRVEGLVHAELTNLEVLLEKCPRKSHKHGTHREWFDVHEGHAIAVIRRWCKWMNNRPYEERLLTEAELEENAKKEKDQEEKKLKRQKQQQAQEKRRTDQRQGPQGSPGTPEQKENRNQKEKVFRRDGPRKGGPATPSKKAKSPRETIPKPPPTTKWQLRSQEKDALWTLCWPMDAIAATSDGEDVGGMEEELRLLTFR